MTGYDIIDNSDGYQCQRLYFQHGMIRGISQRPRPRSQTPVPAMNQVATRDVAPKLNPPKIFTGVRSEFTAFILQLGLIFNSDPTRYPVSNPNIRIAYAASFLAGPAMEWFRPYVGEDSAIEFDTWEQFVAALKAAFDDPDARATAERKLRTLKQGTRDCSTYHAEFAPLATQLRLDHPTRISWFKHGLTYEVSKMMITQPVTEDFNIYVQQAIKVDNALRALNQTRGPTYQTQTQTQNQTSRTPTTASGTAPGPMDLSATTRRAQGPQGPRYQSFQRSPVSAEEKQRRRQNNLCMYCGSPGHWASTCPNKKPPPVPGQGNTYPRNQGRPQTQPRAAQAHLGDGLTSIAQPVNASVQPLYEIIGPTQTQSQSQSQSQNTQSLNPGAH